MSVGPTLIVGLALAPAVCLGFGFFGGWWVAKFDQYWRGYDDAKNNRGFRP